MTSLIQSRRAALPLSARQDSLSFDDWYRLTVGSVAWTWTTDRADTAALWADWYARNPVVFAAVQSRIALFAEARFIYQRLRNSRPADLWGSPELEVLNRPGLGMTTGDLLATWEFDRSTAGNAFAFRWDGSLVVPDPGNVEVLVVELRAAPDAAPFATEVIGYRILDPTNVSTALLLDVEDVAHLKGAPHPAKRYLGMSWVQAVHADVMGDDLVTRHKQKFFEHAATPNMVIQAPGELNDEQFGRLRDMVDRRYAGVNNAHKTLLLEGGATAEVVGADITNSGSLGTLQDHYESRVSMASEVPAPVLGVLLGQNPTYNNYETALRHFIDNWARPSWRKAAEAFAGTTIINVPADSRLWYDDRDIAALREDDEKRAKIRETDARTARTLIDGGYEPESVSVYLATGDPADLTHTGTLSVQLQPPGSGTMDDSGDNEPGNES